MAAPVLARSVRRVPPMGAVVDRTHPLGVGLDFCFVPAYGNVELTHGWVAAVSGSPGRANTGFGPAAVLSTANAAYYTFTGVPDAPFLGPITLAFVGNVTAGPSSNFAVKTLAGSSGAKYTPFDFHTAYNTASPQPLQLVRASSTTFNVYQSGVGLASFGKDSVLVAASPDGTIQSIDDFWGNEINSPGPVQPATGTVAGQGSILRVGRRQDTADQANYSLNMIAIWSRFLSQADVRSLYADPFCFLRW